MRKLAYNPRRLLLQPRTRGKENKRADMLIYGSMENHEIAEIFMEIADLLEIKGESHFRIRSYRFAATAIDGTGESLKSILGSAGEAGLEEIPGIGKSIGAKIVEIIGTGRCAFLDKLLAEMPPGILGILKIGGIGPKKAALLYKELSIGSVEALEKAALSGKLSQLAGFGEKTQEKILKSIEDLKAFSGRSLLSVGFHMPRRWSSIC